jgi:hypothetical protein
MSDERRRISTDNETVVPLRIEIRPALLGWWNWEVKVRNTRPNKWNRAPWLPGKSGTTLTEWGARLAARWAVREIRSRESREPIVYYDPPKMKDKAKSD